MTTDFEYFKMAKKARGTVIECTQAHFDHCLNVLPPMCRFGYYGVGEPYSHETVDGKEEATRHWFMQGKGRYLCVFGLEREARAAFAKA